MNRTDNFETTMQAIALFVLNNSPTACRQEALLQHVVNNGLVECRDTLYLDFRGPDDDCDASLEVRFDFWHSEYVQDETGVWQQAKLQVKVGWPSWGNTNLPLATKRIQMMVKVAELAAKVQGEFGGLEVWKQVYTPEQVAQQEKDKEERRILTVMTRVVAAHAKHMRVRTNRIAGIVENIPNGRYEVRVDGKDYDARVYGNGCCDFTRIT